MTTCHITFENSPMKIVHSGQCVRGTVQLNLKNDANLRGIYIHLYGGVFINWRERLKFGKTHAGNEDYLNQRTYLLGANNGSVFLKLFQIQLIKEEILNRQYPIDAWNIQLFVFL